jgi:molybdopterin synthase sulfur carrier subunit
MRISNVATATDRVTSEGKVTLRYWASARAAAGTDSDALEVPGPVSLAELVQRARAAHADSSRFSDVLGCCSVMVGDRPVTTDDPSGVIVLPGATVEFLPPFAGG